MRHHDLVVIGAGSGNAVIDDRFSHLDVAIIADGPFGGTCLNVGCIPSKMLSHTAEVVDGVADAARFGVDARLDGVRWADVRERVFGRLDPVAAEGEQGRRDTGWITVHTGTARFTGPRRLVVDTADGPVEIEADRIVVAAGSRPVIPPPVADSGLPYETSDTIMRLDAPPRRLAVLGGGYIAAELSHVFSAAGSEVVVIESADVLLDGQDEDVSRTFTEIARERFTLHLGTKLTEVGGEPGALRLVLADGTVVEADTLHVAAGRIPNGDRLDPGKGGIDVDDAGRIVVDPQQRTTADGVWALGDVSTPVPLKHVANREAAVVQHNLLHPGDLRSVSHDAVPSAVFTDPQIAAVGATEQELREAGRPYRRGLVPYSDVAYGWALEDTRGFCKVLADPGTGEILGAHILGPQAPSLIHTFVLAMALGIDARTLADAPYWIHPALTEVVENALRALDGD